MRELTTEERQSLERRGGGFNAFIQEMAPVLTGFDERLGFSKRDCVVLFRFDCVR
jgi:hypothetical protein